MLLQKKMELQQYFNVKNIQALLAIRQFKKQLLVRYLLLLIMLSLFQMLNTLHLLKS